MNEKFLSDYAPVMDDAVLENLGNYFENRELEKRGVTFICFLFLYEKGVWLF